MEATRDMAQHVRTVAILHIVLGVLGVLVALGIALFMGGMGALIGQAEGAKTGDAVAGGLVMGGMGAFIGGFIAVLSIPSIVGGWGLLEYKPWARILIIVVSALSLVNVPVGTIIGAYSLWALLQRETEALFGIAAPAPPPTVS